MYVFPKPNFTRGCDYDFTNYITFNNKRLNFKQNPCIATLWQDICYTFNISLLRLYLVNLEPDHHLKNIPARQTNQEFSQLGTIAQLTMTNKHNKQTKQIT